MTLFWLACARPQPPAEPIAAPVDAVQPPEGIVVLHTGDLHGHFLPLLGLDGRKEGGAVALSAKAEEVRRLHGQDRVLMLDAGDLVTGTPLDTYVVDGAHCGAMVQLVEAMGYDAWTLGNHEFDRGMNDAGALVAQSETPVLSANLDALSGGPVFPGVEPHRVFEVGGHRVAVIGATTESLPALVSVDLELQIASATARIRQSAEVLRDKADVLIALTHLGLPVDEQLALEVPELDLIVGGHTHDRLLEPERIGDTWIVHTGEYGRSLGISRLVPRGDGTVDLHYELATPPADGVEGARPAVVELASQWGDRLEREWGTIVGENRVELVREGIGEVPLGRVVGRALREVTGADVALTNLAGLRDDLPVGPISRSALYGVFPFGNEVVAVRVKGTDLTALAVRNSTAWLNPQATAAMQQDGLRYTWRERMGVPEMVRVYLGDRPIDPNGDYTLATSSFVWRHWERMMGARPRAEPVGTGKTMLETFEAWLAAHGPITDVPEPGGTRVDER